MKEEILCLIPVDSEKLFGIPYVPYSDATQIPCEKCNLMCWIGSKQTKFKKEKPETPLMCAVCLARECQQMAITPNVQTLEAS